MSIAEHTKGVAGLTVWKQTGALSLSLWTGVGLLHLSTSQILAGTKVEAPSVI